MNEEIYDKSGQSNLLDYEKNDLEELEFRERFKIEKRRLTENLCFLEKKKELLEQSRRFIIIALVIGLICFSILIISIFHELPHILISLSIICAFLSGIWFFTNLDNRNKIGNDNICCLIKKCHSLLEEIPKLDGKEVTP